MLGRPLYRESEDSSDIFVFENFTSALYGASTFENVTTQVGVGFGGTRVLGNSAVREVGEQQSSRMVLSGFQTQLY